MMNYEDFDAFKANLDTDYNIGKQWNEFGARYMSEINDLMPFRMLDKLKTVPHPFPYQGSKRYLANAIVPLIPDDVTSIIEPFAGSAAISIAAKYTHKVDNVTIADVNEPLINLWVAMLTDPDGLADEYARMWVEQQTEPKEYFLKVRDDFNTAPSPAAMLYLLNRIVKGALRYSSEGKFNQSADNRRLGAKPSVVSNRIHAVNQIMVGTKVIAADYQDVVSQADDDTVIYMDPPYQGTSGQGAAGKRDQRYAAGLQRSDFERVLDRLNRDGRMYMVSYDRIDQDNTYGQPLSDELQLMHMHLQAGTSAQATLVGKKVQTVESLYLSPALVDRLGGKSSVVKRLNPPIRTLL